MLTAKPLGVYFKYVMHRFYIVTILIINYFTLVYYTLKLQPLFTVYDDS